MTDEEKIELERIASLDLEKQRKSYREGFVDGAEWMLGNPSGGALLHVCNKTAKITKRELIDKVCDFIDKETYEQPILTPSAKIHCVNLGMKHCKNKSEFVEKLKEELK